MNNLICTLAGSLCIYFSYVNLLPYKYSIFKRALIFLYIFNIFFFFEGTLGQTSTFLTSIGIIIFTLLFAKNRIFNLCCYLFGYIYIVAFNYLFMWIAGALLKMDMEALLTHEKLTVIFSVTYCIFSGITTKLIGWYFHENLKISNFYINKHLLTAVFIDLLFLVFLYIFNFSYGEHLGYNYGVIALNGIIFLILFAITAFLMYYIYKITLAEQAYKHRMAQFENLRTYTDRLEESYGVMRKFKHDYMNILSTLSGFLKENDMESLKEYYGERILPISRAFTESDTKLGTLSNIKSTALKSLLSSKFVYMMEIGIKAEIELTEPINDLNMDCLDLSRIIGIFLDNSIEATMETEEKEVRFCMFYKEEDLYLIIQNTAIPPIYAISELRSHEISSKGENRGVGLFNVDTILNNYENTIWNTTYEEPYFTQELILMHKINKEY
ncbi:sensor histidine kinase [Lacrimispora sp.]|uniref:sensor histidine kinase n=3 Tax=Lacrimispora sp. TaxID=2719234 RepID=UPI00289B2492|nr:GHKL domain-containing protein [Lacrimispora sp.]